MSGKKGLGFGCVLRLPHSGCGVAVGGLGSKDPALRLREIPHPGRGIAVEGGWVMRIRTQAAGNPHSGRGIAEGVAGF
jgi:hypothetical protein